MNIADIHPTQCGFRLSVAARVELANHARDGGKFDHNHPIVIDRFDDGALFVRDGHHRVVAIYRCRAERALLEDEYVIENRTYPMYTEADVADGWITPFDPRAEIRLPDLSRFKSDVLDIVSAGIDPAAYISSNRHRYCRARTALDTFDGLSLAWQSP